jgi:Domain of unknown function (DU1801)
VPDDRGNLAGHAGSLRADLFRLRQLVLDTAARNPEIGPIAETIKWGEPSYAPTKRGIGSSVRIAPRKDGKISMNFICHTGLIDRFREIYGSRLNFEGNRTIIVDPAEPLPQEELGHCIAMALTYFRSKSQ